MLTFVVQLSELFKPQFLALHASIRRFYPEAKIVVRTIGRVVVPSDCERIPLPEYTDSMPRERAACVLRELERGSEVCFLGADCELHGPIDPPAGAIVLTPHLVHPVPDGSPLMAAGILPSGLFSAGVFNADFQWVRPVPSAFQAYLWLDAVLEQHCLVAPPYYCNEQSWLTMLPSLFDGVTIWRTRTVNCATYNCMEYGLAKRGDTWTTRDGPLRMFHWSGFNPERPAVLSRYDSRPLRPDLEGFIDEYLQRIASAAGSDGLRASPSSRSEALQKAASSFSRTSS